MAPKELSALAVYPGRPLHVNGANLFDHELHENPRTQDEYVDPGRSDRVPFGGDQFHLRERG